METLERTDADESAPGGQQPRPGGERGLSSLSTKDKVRIGLGFVIVLGLIYWAFVEPKIRTTAVTVLIAVAASAGLWIGANLLFDLVKPRWLTFSTIVFGIVGAIVGITLHGNLVTIGSGTGFLTWVVGPLVGAAAFGALGASLALTDDPSRRRAIAIGGSAAIGLVIGLVIRDAYQPGLDPVAIVVYTLVGAALGAGWSRLASATIRSAARSSVAPSDGCSAHGAAPRSATAHRSPR